MAIYLIQGLQKKILVFISLNSYDRGRMIAALEEAKDAPEARKQEIINAVVGDLERRVALEIRLRPYHDETM